MPGSVRPVADERDGLTAYLDQQRHVLRIAAFGLTDEQLRATPTASPLSVGGLIKHCAAVERTWMDTVLQRKRAGAPDEYEAGFRVEPGETAADVLALHRAAAGETDAVVAGLDLDHPVPVPRDAPWYPPDLEAWSVRWVVRTSSRRPPATPGTPTSSGRPSTAPQPSRSWPRPRTGRRRPGCSPGRRRRASELAGYFFGCSW